MVFRMRTVAAVVAMEFAEQKVTLWRCGEFFGLGAGKERGNRGGSWRNRCECGG